MARRRKSRAPALHRGQRIRDRPRRGPVYVDLIQHIVGEHHDVKRIHAPLGLSLRIALGDRAADPVGHVGGDQVNLLAAHFAERVEELKHRATGPGPARPRQPLDVMIDHDDQIPLALAEADLIDPDPPQPVAHVHLDSLLASHPLKDLTGRSQTTRISSATAVFDVFTVSQTSWSSGALVNRESLSCQRDRGDDHAVASAAHPQRVRLDERASCRDPAPAISASPAEIRSRRSTSIHPERPRSRQPGHDHLVLIGDRHIVDDRLAQPKQPFHTLIPRTLHPLHRIAVFDGREP